MIQIYNMRKTLLRLLILSFIFSACKKNNDFVFNQSPDERINEALASYQSKLSDAENGWKALITTDSGKGGTYSFYFKFDNENRVKMVSDFDSTSAVTLQETSYRLKAEQQPTLIFDTYSYVHILADPNESTRTVQSNVNGGPIGQGLLSDFEFIFDSAKIKADTIELTGKVNHSKLILVKATKEEADAYSSGQFVVFSNYLYKILTYFKRFMIESQLYDIRVEPVTRSIVFSWLDGSGNIQTYSTNYYNVLNGIMLTQHFVNAGLTISSFSNPVWDAGTATLTLTASGKAGVITPTVFPLKVDVAAPRNWWQDAINNANTYWYSWTGFQVNGVDDAFGLQSLTSGTSTYYYLIYWPGVTPANDFFGPVFLNASQDSLVLIYGTAPGIPTFTTDGRAIFVRLGDYGPPNFLTYPATGPAALSKNQLFIAEGYYFVKTTGNNYDMISAKDGKAWISWILAQ
jgi:hypothetical protein